MTDKKTKEFKSGFVSLIGRPNAGKSTLMNNIIGEKIAIMSDKPQTTRNKIQGVYTDQEKQIVFIDTPGIHKPHHKLGKIMVKKAKSSVRDVDVIFYIVDITKSFGSGEAYIISELAAEKTPIFLLLNKIDLVEKEQVLDAIIEYQQKLNFEHIFPVSALEGTDLDLLIDTVSRYLPKGPKYYPDDMITDQPERLIIAELIREKILIHTEEEIPHAIAVEIVNIIPREDDLDYIEANIYVERDSQKGIIIGKKGSMIKKIGSEARTEIENLFAGKVYLDLKVKVRKNWRNDRNTLRSFGFEDKI